MHCARFKTLQLLEKARLCGIMHRLFVDAGYVSLSLSTCDYNISVLFVPFLLYNSSKCNMMIGHERLVGVMKGSDSKLLWTERYCMFRWKIPTSPCCVKAFAVAPYAISSERQLMVANAKIPIFPSCHYGVWECS